MKFKQYWIDMTIEIEIRGDTDMISHDPYLGKL